MIFRHHGIVREAFRALSFSLRPGTRVLEVTCCDQLLKLISSFWWGCHSLVHTTIAIRKHLTPMPYPSKSMRVPNPCLFNKLSRNIRAIMEADPEAEDIKIQGVEWAIKEVEEGGAFRTAGEVEVDEVAIQMVVGVTVSFMTKEVRVVRVVRDESTTHGTKTIMVVVAEVDEVHEDTRVVTMAIPMAQLSQRPSHLQLQLQQVQRKWISFKI